MSVEVFQRLLVDLTVSPSIARSIKRDHSMLSQFELSDLERLRVLSVVAQPGIGIHCSLARGNRFEGIFDVFVMTCVLLKPLLRELLDEFCESCAPGDYQLSGDERRFAAFLEQKISGGLDVEYLPEILAYELACLDLPQDSPDWSDAPTVHFNHDPDLLLPPLSRLEIPVSGLPTGAYLRHVRRSRGVLELCFPLVLSPR